MSESSESRFSDRADRFRRYFDSVGLVIDLFVYTEREIARGDIPLARMALRTGKEINLGNSGGDQTP